MEPSWQRLAPERPMMIPFLRHQNLCLLGSLLWTANHSMLWMVPCYQCRTGLFALGSCNRTTYGVRSDCQLALHLSALELRAFVRSSDAKHGEGAADMVQLKAQMAFGQRWKASSPWLFSDRQHRPCERRWLRPRRCFCCFAQMCGSCFVQVNQFGESARGTVEEEAH